MENQSLFKEFEGLFFEEKEEKKEKKSQEYAYSPFALQDAIGEKSAKKIWIEYQKLLFQGIEVEDLIHKILSKVRDMAFIGLGAEASDLGIKDFPYGKSKRDLKNWKPEELKNFYTKLVSMYHEARMGKEDLEIALEKALLQL